MNDLEKQMIEEPVGVFDDLDETLEPERFFHKGERLGHWIPDDQVMFLKLMVEDREFLFLTYDRVDQNWFDEPELRHILRTIRELYDEGERIAYDALRENMLPFYDLSIEYKEISWLIIDEVLTDMENAEIDGLLKNAFLYKIDKEVAKCTPPSNWS